MPHNWHTQLSRSQTATRTHDGSKGTPRILHFLRRDVHRALPEAVAICNGVLERFGRSAPYLWLK